MSHESSKPLAEETSIAAEEALFESDSERQRHIDELVSQIKESADKLARDGATRGDLKLLSRTLRELRYAFRVFSPFRRRTFFIDLRHSGNAQCIGRNIFRDGGSCRN